MTTSSQADANKRVSTFERYQVLDVIKRAEEHEAGSSGTLSEAASIERSLQQSQQSFHQKALSRADQLAGLTGAKSQLEAVIVWAKRIIAVMALCMVVLGGLAVLQALRTSTPAINIYWLGLMLLGVNTISMVLWFFTEILQQKEGQKSPLVAVFKGVFSRLAARFLSPLTMASWAQLNLTGRIGRWRISCLLHGFWVMYLSGGLLLLLLILASRQVDFVWGTTLLSSDAFVWLTHQLSVLPELFRFAVPDVEQILQSRSGNVVLNPDYTRHAWSGFLIGSILLYGIMPRCLLWLLSIWRLRAAQKSYQPDWNQRYFIQLRARLTRLTHNIGVVDPEQNSERKATDKKTDASLVADTELLSDRLSAIPQEAYSLAYELAERYSWPNPELMQFTDLGNVTTRSQQKELLASLPAKDSTVVCGVMLEQAADRGALRFLRELKKVAQVHLFVLDNYAEQLAEMSEQRQQRWSSWVHIADQAGLSEADVILYPYAAEGRQVEK